LRWKVVREVEELRIATCAWGAGAFGLYWIFDFRKKLANATKALVFLLYAVETLVNG